MSQLHLRKYNQATTINFNLFDLDGVDMSVAATFAAGDIKIMKDEAAEANTGSVPTDEGSGYSLALTAAEMSAARIMIHLIDQTATKVWLDTSIVIETYGNASASHAFDLDTANVTLAAVTHTGAVIPTVTTLTGHTAQTGDSYNRLGAPAGASVSADIAAVKTDTAAILVDTGTTLDTKINDIQGATFDTLTDSLESIRDRGDAAWITGSGSGTADWTASERNEIRGRLGVTGTTSAGGNTPTLALEASIAALNDFDPVNDAVANVTLVATTTTNTDMRGTDSANTIAPDNTSVAAILVDTADMQPKIGTPVTDVSADIAAIQADTDDIQTRLPAALVGGLMSSDVTAISTDTVAADNLELQYDTTGLTGDSFPSTQAQVGALATGSSAISVQAESYTLTTGTQSSGTVTDTETVDATYHQHTDTAGAMELYYQFDVGGNGVASDITVTGRINGANDDLDGIYAYDWVGTSWDRIGDFSGQSGNTDKVNIYSLLTRNTGTGANLGKVRIRFYAASGLTTATLNIDQIFTSYAVIIQSTVYEGGQVWVDTINGSAGTVSFVNGTVDNPSDNIADALIIAVAVGLQRFQVAPGSSITLASTYANYLFNGSNWDLALGGQVVTNSVFEGAVVSGTASGATGEIHFISCELTTCSLDTLHADDCALSGTITFTEAGSYILANCHSSIAGSGTPIIDTGAAIANINLTMPNYKNGIEISNLDATGTDEFSISGNGQIIYSASSSGTVNQRGNWKVTNTGGVTITKDDNSTTIDDWLDGGRLDLLIDRLITQIDTAVGEPGQTAPPVSAKMGLKVDYIYKFLRNRSTSTATTISMYADDAATVDHKATHSDDGTTYDRGEFATGP